MAMRRLVIGLSAVFALVAASCGSSDSTSSDSGTDASGDSVSAEVTVGGSAIVIGPDAQSLDPVRIINTPTAGADLLNAVYDVLYTVTPDTNEFNPRIATDFSTSDGLTWTLTLRDDVSFSDGTPLDAEAVKVNWERVRAQVGAASYGYVQQIEELTVVDATTLEVELNRVNWQFFQVVPVLNLGWIVSPAALDAQGDTYGSDANAVGAGPFVITSRNLGSETTMARNSSYWQEGLPKLDELTYRISVDAQQATDAVVAGQAQAYVFTPAETAQQATDAGLKMDVWDKLQGATTMLFNQNKPPFDDVVAREAVTLAIDVQEMLDVITFGIDQAVETLFQEESPFFNPDYKFPETDKARAQELFDELSAANGGQPLTFEIAVSTNVANQARVTQLQTQLNSFDNVQAELKVIDGPQYGLALFQGDFNMALYAVASPDPEPQFYQMSSTYPVKIADMQSAQADAALLAGLEATDLAGRKAAYDSLQEAVLDTWSQIWMYRNITRFIHSVDTDGIVSYGQGSHLFDEFGFVG